LVFRFVCTTFATIINTCRQILVNKFLIKIRQKKRLWWALTLLAVFVYLGTKAYQFIDTEFTVAEELPFYHIGSRPDDDTLRVVIIGDSWAENHMKFNCNALFQQYASRWINTPVKCMTKGKEGALSKEIYHYMFRSYTQEDPWMQNFCTQPLLEEHPDYCVVMSGINDTWKKRPVSYYTGNYRLIIRLLLANNIRPVIMEIPDFEMGKWLDENRKRQRMTYRIYSYFTHVVEDDITPFRNGLRKMLTDTGLGDSILFIPAAHWLPKGHHYSEDIYQTDHIHLTYQGYHLLDSCIAAEIITDYKKRNKTIGQ